MNRLLSSPTCNTNLPSRNWLMWLMLSRTVWNYFTLLLSGYILYQLAVDFYSGRLTAVTVLHIPLYAWWFWVWLIWLYWGEQLKGTKPHAQPGCHYLDYLSYEGRRLFWRALITMYHRGRQQLSSADLVLTFWSGIETRLVFVRLGITSQELTAALGDEVIPFEDFIKSATNFAISERSHISWDDMLQALFRLSARLKTLFDARHITIDEALAVVEWSRDDWYRRRASRYQFHTRLGELFKPQRNLNKAWTARPTPTLDAYSQNLTELAKVGLLTSARVREDEVEEAIRILSRSERNNLILVGEAGVGKTSIVGDIALRMIQGQLPALTDSKLVALDIGMMIAGKLGFEKLFSMALTEAAASGNTVLFIGNIDQLGKSKTEAGFDISAILISALTKPDLQIIATADPVNYKKYVENNDTLSQKFARLEVNELDSARAILVLEDLSYQIEDRQGVLITLEAVKASVELSQNLIHTSKLPDKAMDLLDEAAVLSARQGRRQVTRADVEEILSTKTNVPVGELTADERSKLSQLKAKIHSRMIDQEEAATAVSEALKRARLNVSADVHRPIGSFLFLGPTGVGKTELAKSLAWAYFGDETKMIRLDMSEYQTVDSISRLLGAPSGAGEVALAGGSFTEAVKNMPFAVVLLDEIDKAHPDILNVFLQVFDEGRLTDNLGNTIDFAHTIIIATSNAQARFIEEGIRLGKAYTDIQSQMRELLVQQNFTPEFINRFDGVIVFTPLTPDQILQIAQLKVTKLQQYLAATKHIQLTVTDAAIMELAHLGYDPAFGARPLERVIRDRIGSKVADALLADPTLSSLNITPTDLTG